MSRKFFSMEKDDKRAILSIYGDITSYPFSEGDVSASSLSRQLETLKDVEQIDVFINSYGGEVAEGLAIYNALRRHSAKVTTYCDGFAASIASVIFMAGDERIMNEASLLMIHNAWTMTAGNAAELRKQADDLEKITQASVEAYKAHSSLSEEEIKALMDAETWILPVEAIEYGFATGIEKNEKKAASQHAFKQLFEIIKAYQAEEEEAPEDEEEQEAPETEEPETENEENTEEAPEDEEAPEAEPEEEQEEEPSADEEEAEEETEEQATLTAQMWSGFFNAILKK